MIHGWAINGFHAPIDEFRFGFQRMDDKVKDEIVLSDNWSWEILRVVLGLCFSFGYNIKKGTN